MTGKQIDSKMTAEEEIATRPPANAAKQIDSSDGNQGDKDKAQDAEQTGQAEPQDGKTGEGKVTLSDVGVDPAEFPGLPLARARDGETIRQTRERLRWEGRAAGMNRRQATAYAATEADRLHPWQPPDPPEEPPEQGQKRQDVAFENLKPAPPKDLANSGRVQGLQDLPDHWPELPGNASLQAEIGWVQAERLRIVEEQPGGATVVHLDRARSPAPSMAALGWLETSIRSYAKYVDVAAKATSTQHDEAELVRHERMAIDEVRALLGEMLGDACPTCGRPT